MFSRRYNYARKISFFIKMHFYLLKSENNYFSQMKLQTYPMHPKNSKTPSIHCAFET